MRVKVQTLGFLLALASAGIAAPAAAGAPWQRFQEQDAAYKGRQQGRIMPLRAIEALIVPTMRGAEYLGPELDSEAGRYRLKFMRAGRVIWVDVDARTGEVLGRSGN